MGLPELRCIGRFKSDDDASEDFECFVARCVALNPPAAELSFVVGDDEVLVFAWRREATTAARAPTSVQA